MVGSFVTRVTHAKVVWCKFFENFAGKNATLKKHEKNGQSEHAQNTQNTQADAENRLLQFPQARLLSLATNVSVGEGHASLCPAWGLD